MKQPQPFIVGRPALLMIDFQRGGFLPGNESGIPHMGGMPERAKRAKSLVSAARAANIPVIFVQEVHRPDHVDFGRELDGEENLHCIEGQKDTEIAADEVDFRPGDYHIPKRRYSAFFATDLELLLKGLKVQTLVMLGGLTDVCVHYSFVDGHQNNYYCRVVEDCVGGSSRPAHDAALVAMEYLQTGARCTSAQVLAAFAAFAPSKVA
jgi:nicotinamidase-related amidase